MAEKERNAIGILLPLRNTVRECRARDPCPFALPAVPAEHSPSVRFDVKLNPKRVVAIVVSPVVLRSFNHSAARTRCTYIGICIYT